MDFMRLFVYGREVYRKDNITATRHKNKYFVNVFSSENGIYILLQVVSSFCVSVCYCAVTIRWGSVLPCILAHIMTNIFAAEEIVVFPALVCCILLHALWGSITCLKIQKEEEKQNEILH